MRKNENAIFFYQNTWKNGQLFNINESVGMWCGKRENPDFDLD